MFLNSLSGRLRFYLSAAVPPGCCCERDGGASAPRTCCAVTAARGGGDGSETGLSPLQRLAGIYIKKGRCSIWAFTPWKRALRRGQAPRLRPKPHRASCAEAGSARRQGALCWRGEARPRAGVSGPSAAGEARGAERAPSGASPRRYGETRVLCKLTYPVFA